MRATDFIIENDNQAAIDALLKKHGWSTGKTVNGDLAFTWEGNTYVFYGERMRINYPNNKSISVVWGKKPDWQGRNDEFSFVQAVQNKYLTNDLSIWQALDRGQINDTQAIQKFKEETERQAREAIAQGITEGWKDWVAGATLGAAALAPQAADAKSAPLQPKTAVTAQQKAQEPINLISMKDTEAEKVLHRAAVKAGIKGVELAQFLAQARHESDDFSRMKEYGGKQYFAKLYDPKSSPRTAKILGNTQVGDGVRYHGRGFIQITGRDNYRMAGKALGLPLEQQPELAARPDVAAKIAVWYWKTRVKPYINNFNDTKAVTQKINPAMRGLQDRHAKFIDYKNIL